jgi:hypothetical protein
MRTVCHGCRGVMYETGNDTDGITVMRPVIVPGDGTVTRMVTAAGESGETPVTLPCTICADSDTPGWVSDFVPPL